MKRTTDCTSPSFARSLLSWYDRARRDLPWRPLLGTSNPVDPYAILVSELMLQQTQVSTVIPYFQKFLIRYPTAAALAAGDEQELLRLWQGLGYYSRARHLQSAARVITERHDGNVPANLEHLSALPGVGRYTAGAVASIAFGIRAPIVDGNVARVLCRLDCIRTHPTDRETNKRLWERTAQILPHDRVGDFNSALMELGATVCTPKSPKCLICPVQKSCKALAAGLQESIPPPRVTKTSPLNERWTFLLRSGNRWLIEQRPRTGRWAGMWQFVTVPVGLKSPTPAMLRKSLGLKVSQLQSVGEIRHTLTHRKYIFKIFAGVVTGNSSLSPNRKWMTLAELDRYPLSRPQTLMIELIKDGHTRHKVGRPVVKNSQAAPKISRVR